MKQNRGIAPLGIPMPRKLPAGTTRDFPPNLLKKLLKLSVGPLPNAHFWSVQRNERTRRWIWDVNLGLTPHRAGAIMWKQFLQVVLRSLILRGFGTSRLEERIL